MILDHAGFIEPLKHLMVRGKIKGTPEAIYQCLQRAPGHIARSKAAELTAMEGVYWSMVDSAHGALIAAGYFPPSPEHVMTDLKEAFVELIKKLELKNGQILWPLRYVLSGVDKSPGVFELVWVLGKEESIKRITFALNLLCR